VTGRVGIGPTAGGGCGLAVELDVELPAVPRAESESLIACAHQVCPYSNATRGNIEVIIKVTRALEDAEAAA
jgi:osmotically inducible protein OsmC